VIGGGDWAADRLVPDFYRAIAAGETLQVGHPMRSAPWQHVLEPLTGYVVLAEALQREPQRFARAFNFGPGDSGVRPVGWVLDQLCAHHAGARWAATPDATRHEAQSLKIDSSLAAAELGWRPRWTLETAPGPHCRVARARRVRRCRRALPRTDCGLSARGRLNGGMLASPTPARRADADRSARSMPTRADRSAGCSATPSSPRPAGAGRCASPIYHHAAVRHGRGMHFQCAAEPEYKLVTCLAGAVFDVAIDLRRGSETFLHWHGERLSADSARSLLIPPGFAHGFQSLSDDVQMLYFHSAAYCPPRKAACIPPTRSSASPGRSRLSGSPIAMSTSPADLHLSGTRAMICRHCHADDSAPFVDLGFSPPSNAYLTQEQLSAPEVHYPLRVFVCRRCRLVQTEDFAQADALFSADYAYFSSFSDAWLRHARDYVAAMRERYGLSANSMVVEVAANDGYLLQFVADAGIPCLGIEPTRSTAEAARVKGIPIVEEFFGRNLARRLAGDGKSADLMIANNVLAHVPDINDFVGGFSLLLKPQGVATFEFPHLAELIAHAQFDTIYHEHFSYLSLLAVEAVFAGNGLKVFDVERLSTHGGSLRVHGQRSDTGTRPVTPAVLALRAEEDAAGLGYDDAYRALQSRAEGIRDALLTFLIQAKRDGKRVAAYGAAPRATRCSTSQACAPTCFGT
jgi:hypothetical protein